MSASCDDWTSDADDTSSVGDEERVRKLFQACDYNKDGYIDRFDLEMVMEELGLTQSAEELLVELGADHTGRVSYQDFLNKRRALCCEIDFVKKSDLAVDRHSAGTGSLQDVQDTSVSHSGSSFNNKQEQWEWDSGARDLSPEPLTGQLSVTPPPDAAMADLASTLHLAAVSSLKNEVLELSARLHAAQRDRDNARDALCASQSECARLREALSTQARCSEERITELHGVIAELRRVCVARERAAIPETLEDDSEVETSYKDNSITGYSDRTTSPCEADETASVQNEAESPGSPAALPVPDFPPNIPHHNTPHHNTSHHNTNTTNTNSNNNINTSSQEQVERLNLAPADSTSFDEEDIIEIDKRLRNRKRASPRSPRRNLNNDLTQHQTIQRDEDNDIYNIHRSNRHSPCVRSGIAVSSCASPQSKMASRVRLRKTHEDGRLTGKDICQEGVFSSTVAEHLTRGAVSGGGNEELEGEERMIARIDRLEADNMLLSVTLKESKEYADRLSLTCAQCSAEAGALRLALAAADRTVEAYDVLLALAETTHYNQDPSNNASKLRQATERVARQLLARLDWESANGGAGGGMCIGPWADHAAMLQYQSVNEGKAWSMEEEERLRGHVSRLKRERTIAASGAQSAQWPLQEDGTEDNLSGVSRDKGKCLEPGDIRKMDMETAVLMQEVMSLREERAELKARLRSLKPSGNRQPLSTSSGGDECESERRLLEALARENTLKSRLQRLMASVHQTGRMQDSAVDDMKKYACPNCGTPPNRCEDLKPQSPHPNTEATTATNNEVNIDAQQHETMEKALEVSGGGDKEDGTACDRSVKDSDSKVVGEPEDSSVQNVEA